MAKRKEKNKGLIGRELIVDVYMSIKKFNGKMMDCPWFQITG